MVTEASVPVVDIAISADLVQAGRRMNSDYSDRRFAKYSMMNWTGGDIGFPGSYTGMIEGVTLNSAVNLLM